MVIDPRGSPKWGPTCHQGCTNPVHEAEELLSTVKLSPTTEAMAVFQELIEADFPEHFAAWCATIAFDRARSGL